MARVWWLVLLGLSWVVPDVALASESGSEANGEGMTVSAVSSAGVAFTQGLDGGSYVRWGADFGFPRERGPAFFPRPIMGFDLAVEAWGNPNARGVGLPALVYGGVVFGEQGIDVGLRVGAGFSACVLDVVDDEVGGGLYAPVAMLSFGTETKWVAVHYDFRVAYRWEWVLEDRLQVQFGGSLSFPFLVLEDYSRH